MRCRSGSSGCHQAVNSQPIGVCNQVPQRAIAIERLGDTLQSVACAHHIACWGIACTWANGLEAEVEISHRQKAWVTCSVLGLLGVDHLAIAGQHLAAHDQLTLDLATLITQQHLTQCIVDVGAAIGGQGRIGYLDEYRFLRCQTFQTGRLTRRERRITMAEFQKNVPSGALSRGAILST